MIGSAKAKDGGGPFAARDRCRVAPVKTREEALLPGEV